MTAPERWLAHGPMSDPGSVADLAADLPDDLASLVGVVQGLLIHCEWLGAYGLDVDRMAPPARTTLPVEARLQRVLRTDERPLTMARAPERRQTGTCRDFALMLCAFLRCKGVPARVRCGFAAYFGDGWEDHWVCEMWDAQRGAWRLSDPQLDEPLRAACGVTFDATDLPQDAFLRAGQAWAGCRTGEIDADRCGHGETAGLWFVKVNVWRDHLSVNGRETSPWDDWRACPAARREVGEHELALLDRIAAQPKQTMIAAEPDWLA